MRRTPLIVALAALLLCAAAGFLVRPVLTAQAPGPSPADEKQPRSKAGPPGTGKAAPIAEQAAKLPISQVVLFTSGVGFFQREGQVAGDARIDLSFPVGDINDLLKSIVLRDLNGGQIRTVGYDSLDPIEKTLKTFAVNFSGNPSFAQLLNQVRGEKVSVTWQAAGQVRDQSFTGTIVGVEKQKLPVNKDAVAEIDFLNVWSDDAGIRNIKLSEVKQIRFQNEALNSEVRRALEVVARSHDVQRKTVSFHFTGKGTRKVQIGYVVEHPVWRTSYRLVLSDQTKPFLQGWALVENPTNEDWNNIAVRLVSGRPISYRMDLYEPLYVDRPLVELPTFANVRPRLYEGLISGLPMPPALPMRPEAPVSDAEDYGRRADSKKASKDQAESLQGLEKERWSAKDLQKMMAPAMAQGVKLGDQFQYVLDHTISVPRQKSAMLPIVNNDVEAIRASIYNEQNLAEHPLLGLKLKNNTDLHLMQGPITVFDEGSYAGDAVIENLQPGEERLLSYAVDLGVEVATAAKSKPDPQVRLSITKGILHKKITLRETKTYTVKNRADKDKLVILEHPVRAPEYELIAKQEPPKSRNFYRFELNVAAGKSEKQEVIEERKVVETVALTNAESQALVLLLQDATASPSLKAALKKAIDLKNQLGKTQQEIADAQQKLQAISQEQARQRENMKVIPQTEPVYKTYLDKFVKQEEEIDRLRTRMEQLQRTAIEHRQAYEDFVVNLTLKEE